MLKIFSAGDVQWIFRSLEADENSVILSAGAIVLGKKPNISARSEAKCVTFQFDMFNISLLADVRWIFRLLDTDGNAVIFSS